MMDANTLERKNGKSLWKRYKQAEKGTSQLPEPGEVTQPLFYLHLISKIRRQDEIIYKVAISFKNFMSSEPLKHGVFSKNHHCNFFFNIPFYL